MADPRRQITGARSRASGEMFEGWISAACDFYQRTGYAVIEKTPEPMKPLGKADRFGRFLACFTKQAQPDFKGALCGGRCRAGALQSAGKKLYNFIFGRSGIER